MNKILGKNVEGTCSASSSLLHLPQFIRKEIIPFDETLSLQGVILGQIAKLWARFRIEKISNASGFRPNQSQDLNTERFALKLKDIAGKVSILSSFKDVEAVENKEEATY